MIYTLCGILSVVICCKAFLSAAVDWYGGSRNTLVFLGWIKRSLPNLGVRVRIPPRPAVRLLEEVCGLLCGVSAPQIWGTWTEDRVVKAHAALT